MMALHSAQPSHPLSTNLTLHNCHLTRSANIEAPCVCWTVTLFSHFPLNSSSTDCHIYCPPLLYPLVPLVPPQLQPRENVHTLTLAVRPPGRPALGGECRHRIQGAAPPYKAPARYPAATTPLPPPSSPFLPSFSHVFSAFSGLVLFLSPRGVNIRHIHFSFTPWPRLITSHPHTDIHTNPAATHISPLSFSSPSSSSSSSSHSDAPNVQDLTDGNLPILVNSSLQIF